MAGNPVNSTDDTGEIVLVPSIPGTDDTGTIVRLVGIASGQEPANGYPGGFEPGGGPPVPPPPPPGSGAHYFAPGYFPPGYFPPGYFVDVTI